MWGLLLLVVCVATTITACWGFGCCGVVWNVTKFGTKAGGVCALSTLGVLVIMFMTLTIYHFLFRMLA